MESLAAGMKRHVLSPHPDGRGTFTEIFRESWGLGPRPVQWNVVRSRPKTVRGLHVHLVHLDYWMLVSGVATVGYRDLRRHSPTAGQAGALYLTGEIPEIVVIPPGVAHGFQFHTESIHVYAVTHYWNLADELGCRWNDPEAGIPWPEGDALLSPRDRDSGPLAELLKEMEPHQEALYAPPPGR